MIYILTLIVIIILSYKYDIKGEKKYKERWYNILLIWFIAISGFAYNVGSDIPFYMESYTDFTPYKLNKQDNIFTNYRYQPGWIILNIGCNLITSDFVILKMIIASFLNCVIFRFIKKHCKAIFLGVFFYAIFMYFDLNFNTLRQSMAIGFFLIGYEYLCQGKVIKYILFIGIGFLFHSSAIVFLPILCLPYVKLNKLLIIIILSCTVICLYLALTFDFITHLNYFLTIFGGDISTEFNMYSNAYLVGSESEISNIVGVIHWLIDISMLCFIAYYQFLHMGDNRLKKMDILILILYIFFTIATLAIPIVMYRLLHFIRIFYVVLLADTLIEVSKKYFRKNVAFTYLILIIITYYPIKSYFNINPTSQLPLIVQYYPYYSIFNKKISPIRAAEFGYYK